jgi:DNA helicase-2/ATP-dependent DNA helicase PcrA
LNKEEDVEEERRLAFVGITRAKEELYLSHARLREFRGQTLYAVPSMFLDELGEEGMEAVDLSASAGGSMRAMDEWRSGSRAADQGWVDAGVKPRSTETPQMPSSPTKDTSQGFAEGMVVRHDSYGVGRITEVSGYGAMRKLKIRFKSAGERTFLADKAKLAIVRKS